jgi:hypothetical protein
VFYVGAAHDYLSDLIKHCPNLRVFKLNTKKDGKNMDLLADSLRNNCPGLQPLLTSNRLKSQKGATSRGLDPLLLDNWTPRTPC